MKKEAADRCANLLHVRRWHPGVAGEGQHRGARGFRLRQGHAGVLVGVDCLPMVGDREMDVGGDALVVIHYTDPSGSRIHGHGGEPLGTVAAGTRIQQDGGGDLWVMVNG